MKHVKYFLDGFIPAFLWWAALFVGCFIAAKVFMLVVGS